MNKEAQLATLFITGIAVAFIGWAVVHLSSSPIYNDGQRPAASRLRRWLAAANARLQKVPK